LLIENNLLIKKLILNNILLLPIEGVGMNVFGFKKAVIAKTCIEKPVSCEARDLVFTAFDGGTTNQNRSARSWRRAWITDPPTVPGNM
jgi:hypothetical protein